MKFYEIHPQRESYSHFIEAFTIKSKDHDENLEVWETIGDSVLKLITGIFIYMAYPSCDEG